MANEKKISLENLKLYLEQQDYPRLQMTMMVMGTALAGMLASWVLIHLGIIRMGWRYSCSVLCAYLAFLGLLRIWLHFEGRRIQVDLGILFAIAGHFMQAYAPEARSIGGVWQHYLARHELSALPDGQHVRGPFDPVLCRTVLADLEGVQGFSGGLGKG